MIGVWERLGESARGDMGFWKNPDFEESGYVVKRWTFGMGDGK